MLKQKKTNQKVCPTTESYHQSVKKLDIKTQPGKFTALKAAAAPYKKIDFQRNTNSDNNGNEEFDFSFLRKIDFNSFLAYLIGFISFNAYYWIDMIYG